jgi:hypothetical protein
MPYTPQDVREKNKHKQQQISCNNNYSTTQGSQAKSFAIMTFITILTILLRCNLAALAPLDT